MSGFYTEEEKKELFQGFWVDGESRNVTITKEPYTAQSGKSLMKLNITDVDNQANKLEINFDLQNALRSYTGEVEATTVFKVTPTKNGEREYNGNTYDTFSFTVEETGQKAAPVEEVKVEDIPF